MNKIKKIFQRAVIGIFCFMQIVPVVPQAAANNNANWSETDWNQEVLLPQDLDSYYLKAMELEAKGDTEALANLKPQMRKMGDSEVMQHFNVPPEVQMKVMDNEKVEEVITPVDPKKEKFEKYMPKENVLNLKDAKKLNIESTKSYTEVINTKPVTTIRKIESKTPNKLFNATFEGIKKKQSLKSADINFKQLLGAIYDIKTANAAWAVPLITYYTGLENNTMDFILYYLSAVQNTDGSFGTYNKYELTAEIALLLSSMNKVNNDQYNAAIQYLTSTVPQNNREKAIKARLMYALGQPYQTYLNELAAVQNADGGFGVYNYYESDVLTTLEVSVAFYITSYSLQNQLPKALYFVTTKINADGSMYFTENSESAYYLINRTAYYLYPFRSMTVSNGGGINVNIQAKIDSLLNFLRTNYDAATGELYGTDDIIDKAMVISTFKSYETDLDIQKNLTEIVKGDQYIDGSFGNSLYSTVEALRALRQSDLVITNLSSSGALVNKTAATFQATIENRGYAATNHAFIYTFVDNYNINAPIDLLGNGYSIGPGETLVLSITYPNTNSFIGLTEVKLYAEDESETNYDNNWIANNYTFASAADNTPALPMYFIAQQHSWELPSLNVRWQKKTDPNRLNYVIGIREHGTTDWGFYGISDSWNGAFVKGACDEGVEYDVTAGVLHNDQNTVTYFTNYTTLRATASDTLYKGTVNAYFSENQNVMPNQGVFSYAVLSSTDENGNVSFTDVPNGSNAANNWEEYYENIWTKYNVPEGQTVNNVRLFTRLKPDTEKPVITQFNIRYKANYIVMNQHTVEFLVQGTDNVGLKEADIYYYDPADSSWNFLITEQFNKQTSLTSPWYISEEMLGAGYKVKAVIRDYRGNESDPVEWGPFEIIDGTSPVFELVAPNGGEAWELGASEDIAYNATSVNGISNIDLWLWYEGTPYSHSRDIKLNGPNTGSYTYTVPLEYNLVSDKVKVRVSGEDNVTYLTSLDYSDNYFSIIDTTPIPSDPWGDPYIISEPFVYNPAGGSTYSPMIKYGSNGIGHIVYRYQHDDHQATNRQITDQLYYMTYNSGTGVLSQPVKIYENVQITDAGLNGFTSMQEMNMVLDSNNRPHIIWATFTYTGVDCERYNTQEIFYMNFNGSVWSAAQNISNNSTSSRSLDIAADNSGNVYAIWLDGTIYDAACGTNGVRTVYYRKKPSGSSWSAVEQLASTDSPSNPQIAVTADNRIHLVFYSSSSTALKYMYKDANWSGISSVAAGSAYMVQLEKGTNNSLHLIFRKDYTTPGRGVATYINLNNNVWSAEQFISPDQSGFYADFPQIVVDENNIPYVTYELYENSYKYIFWTTPVNNVWQTPQKIHRESQKGSEYHKISYAGNNKMSAVWQIYNEYRTKIMINHADLTTYSPSIPPTFQFIEPNGTNDTADGNFNITWNDSDPDSNAMINLFYDTDNIGQNGTSVNLNIIYEDDPANSYTWDTRSVPEGTYYLYAVIDDEENSPVTVYSANTITINHHVIYEDAENGNTLGWNIFDNIPIGAQVNNIYDAVKVSRVIELVGAGGTLNGFRLFNDSNAVWNDTEHFVIQWDHKIGSSYAVYVDVTTNLGKYSIYYTPGTVDKLGTGKSVHHALGMYTQNNNWQTITRDLEADLHEAQPNVTLISVNSFIVRAVGRFDNIQLMRDYPEGLDSDGDGISDTEEVYTLHTNQNLTDTDGDGLNDYDEINTWLTNPKKADSDSDGYNDNIELIYSSNPNDPASYPMQTVYEDAENGNTYGWSVFDKIPAGATIQNVIDAAHGGRVISLTGSGTSNGYRLYSDFNKPWSNTNHFVIQWDQKFSENFYIYVDVNTTSGRKYLYYSPVANNLLGTSSVHHGLGVAAKNGTWQTFTRDLVADLHEAQPAVNILSVNSLLVRGSGRMDNIKLLKEMP